MSGETTEEDLKGRILSDSKSFSGLKFKKGYFSEAFINGKILLLDEINLANQSVLNFIANALDSKLIMLEQDENENGSHIFQMHENFRLIATQNPNNDSFLGKREELPEKLLQEFNIIDFPSLSKNELKYIVKEIANNNNYKNLNLIDKITELHYDWSKSDESKVSPQLFTIRDIKNVINAISKEKPYQICDALMCFYGMRYPEKEKNSFKNEVLKISTVEEKYEFKKVKFENCYESSSLKEVDKYADIAISNGRHLLFTGYKEVGVTSIARWIAQKNSINPEKNFVFVFTEETTIGDLIGRFIPSYSDNLKNIIEWKDGPLTEAIKYGYSGLFLNIESTDTKILERINCLLDQKENISEDIFKIPENPDIEYIKIHPNFRFYCTCSFDKLNSISDKFLNRLTILFVEDQIKEINDDDEKLEELIKILMKQEIKTDNLPLELIKELFDFQKKKIYDI